MNKSENKEEWKTLHCVEFDISHINSKIRRIEWKTERKRREKRWYKQFIIGKDLKDLNKLIYDRKISRCIDEIRVLYEELKLEEIEKEFFEYHRERMMNEPESVDVEENINN